MHTILPSHSLIATAIVLVADIAIEAAMLAEPFDDANRLADHLGPDPVARQHDEVLSIIAKHGDLLLKRWSKPIDPRTPCAVLRLGMIERLLVLDGDIGSAAVNVVESLRCIGPLTDGFGEHVGDAGQRL